MSTTDEQIREMRAGALDSGDHCTVVLCDVALDTSTGERPRLIEGKANARRLLEQQLGGVKMAMLVDKPGIGECDDGELRKLHPGMVAEYLSTLHHGSVRVRLLDGTEVVAHPHIFPTLR